MKNIFKGKLKFIILLILIILGLVYYFTHRNKKEKIYTSDYSYIEVQKTDEMGTLNLNGYIKANNPIGIFVDKKLKVKEVFIKNGDFVEKGQVLMTFDDDEANKLNRNIEKERINLQKTQRDLKTTRELYKLGGASKDEVRNLEDNARISQLNIDEYIEVLNKTATEVKSPVDGVVSNLKAQENYLVDTDSALLEIIDSNDLRVIVEIPEYNSQSVKLGQSVEVRQDISDDDKVYEGEITKISRLSTTSSLTSENVLEAEVKTKEVIPNLVPGFKIKAVLQLKAEEKNIIIPKIALQSENGKYFVFTFDNKNTVKRKEVAIKNIAGDNIIITSGLNVGERLILTPDNRLFDGLILTEGDSPNSNGGEDSIPADETVAVEK
ncbi:efflux RND transporter periplasmic adaptor subunit [Fusobacterium canifelinum]|uniref:Efflux RND transporter periplasmic adaptor subunit n=1 Tax=Fusobacterium canifelinum TaxID=285729 RepID=A0A7T4FMT5_9FUSO|nr:efflux RND transporter periplasmic adaptor subunit [Fusobacterium canifelinum]QQB73383.1 efflux RND transporter periplasmic adaptor subunit [Fusobacterium canifelinum]